MGRSISFKSGSAEDTLQVAAQAGGNSSLLRSGRGLRLGLGAVTRTSTGTSKTRGPSQTQRSTLVFSQPVLPVSPATSQKGQDNTGEFNIFCHFVAAMLNLFTAVGSLLFYAAVVGCFRSLSWLKMKVYLIKMHFLRLIWGDPIGGLFKRHSEEACSAVDGCCHLKNKINK